MFTVPKGRRLGTTGDPGEAPGVGEGWLEPSLKWLQGEQQAGPAGVWSAGVWSVGCFAAFLPPGSQDITGWLGCSLRVLQWAWSVISNTGRVSGSGWVGLDFPFVPTRRGGDRETGSK